MQVTTDWVGLIDEWALRFFDELDYTREAQNSIIFSEQMAHLDGISVCEVFPEFTTRTVLTTAWVQGGPSCMWLAGVVMPLALQHAEANVQCHQQVRKCSPGLLSIKPCY